MTIGIKLEEAVPKVYLSGKIAGIDFDEAVKNFALAELEVMGHFGDIVQIANPIIIGKQLENNMERMPTKDEFMMTDLQALAKCDSVYMLSNWRDSAGAKIEHDLAHYLGKSIIYQ